MLNKLRKPLCCCCSRGNRLTGQWSALTRVSINLPYQIGTNLSRRSYQTCFARFPFLRGAMLLSRWQRTVCSRSLLLITRVCQNEGDVISHIFEVIPSPDASRPVADQEVDVGNDVKPTLTGFITEKKLSPELVIPGTLFEERRTCLYFSDCKEVAYHARQNCKKNWIEHGCIFLWMPEFKFP